MKLTLKDIKPITLGTLDITECDGNVCFSRFTDNQLEHYKNTNESFYKKAKHTASILMDFTTDSETLSFHYEVSEAATRTLHYFDIYENDMMILHIGADTLEVTGGDVNLKLGRGMKRIRIYFPFSQKTVLRDFTLDDGAAVIASERQLDALILGDSITQGYDARYPSLSYVNLMTERYNLNYVNQSIGGEGFGGGVIGGERVCDPDFIIVALGINDWASRPFDTVERDADDYFKKLSELYEGTPLIFISPIWINREGNDTSLIATVEMLESVASSYGAHIIHGLDLVPHDKGMYSDGTHPTDLGFNEYANRLFARLDGLVELIKKTKEEKANGLTVL